jgi:single-strand DNA-binding protein
MDLNKVMLIWRSTNTLQVKTIESTQSSFVNFTVATNRRYKNKEWNLLEEAEYHRCVAYWNSAEVLWKYLTKGKRIYIEWRLRTRKRQDAEGNDRFSTEIIVDNFIFLDSKAQESDDIEESTIGTFDDEIPF